MSELPAKLITADQALAMLKDRHAQRNERFPRLMTPGRYILPDYQLTRKREAFKIRRHTFLKKRPRSYVAFDSSNGQTLWLHNFPSLSEALFWLDTGLKPADTDSGSSYKQWTESHSEDITAIKDQLRALPKPKKAAVNKAVKNQSKTK